MLSDQQSTLVDYVECSTEYAVKRIECNILDSKQNQEWRMVKPSEPCYEDKFEITENVYINLKYLSNLIFSLAMHLEMLVYRRCRWRCNIKNEK